MRSGIRSQIRERLIPALLVLMLIPLVWPIAPTSALADEMPSALPSEFYLTNLGYVTPAKLQSPWGTCWAFAVASAIESSILKASAELDDPSSDTGSDASPDASQDTGDGDGALVSDEGGFADHPMAALRGGAVSALDDGTSEDDATDTDDSSASDGLGDGTSPYEGMDAPDLSKLDDSVDISERAIGWYAHEPQSEASGGSQAGEGYVRKDTSPLAQFEGGNFSIATAILVARQALVSESAAPYRYNGYDGSDVAWFRNPGNSGGADARQKDWSLGNDLRAGSDIGWHVSGVLELSSPAILETDASTGMSVYKGYDDNATRQIKETLMDVGAVAVCLNSELSLPSELSTNSVDENTLGDAINYSTWSQYSAATEFMLNHAVTIVGWDDSYPIEAFRNASGSLPPASGAWLCKNNWGNGQITSSEGSSSGLVNWGIRTGNSSDGQDASGFFWLSYYDHTLSTPVAFEVSPDEETNLYQYDYLGASEFFHPTTYTSDVLVANVFTAKSTELIESIGGWTFGEDETIRTYVYALPEQSGDIYAGERFKEALAGSSLLGESEDTFEIAGFHEIDLAQPLLVYEGERFAVIQQVSTVTTTFSGELAPASYLNLEVAFTDVYDYENVSSRPNVVSNAGETFVSVYGPDDWRSVDEYNDWYVDLKMQGLQDVDMVFGNALIKAESKDTSMTSSGRVYAHVKLDPIS